MIETVIPIVEQADIFVVIGTSLQVYPAAGLLEYTNPQIPIFILDKNIPKFSKKGNIKSIEAPATLGIEILKKELELLK